MDFSEAIRNYSGQPLTRQVLLSVLREYRRPNEKINELVKQKLLVRVKSGVFIPGPNASIQTPENFLLANHVCGPSYVSSDSALSYWGLIPERVYETVSMTTKLSKTYKTPIGRFRYIRLPLPYYSFGIQCVEIAEREMILIAGKEKSLCDKIVTTQRLQLRSVKQTREYLLEDLRIDRDSLRELDIGLIEDYLAEAPKRESIYMLIKTLREL